MSENAADMRGIKGIGVSYDGLPIDPASLPEPGGLPAATSTDMPAFLLQQKIVDAFRDIEKYLRQHEMVVAVHPDDLTDELRRMIEDAPLTTLRETRHITRGQLYVIHPGLLEDLYAR